ncbi:unnamed protein product, partial [Gulo gulo]
MAVNLFPILTQIKDPLDPLPVLLPRLPFPESWNLARGVPLINLALCLPRLVSC